MSANSSALVAPTATPTRKSLRILISHSKPPILSTWCDWRRVVNRPRNHQIEVPSSAVLEDGNLLRRAPGGDAARNQVEKIAFDLVARDDAPRDRVGEVAAVGNCEAQRVGEEPAAADDVVVA